MQSNTIIIIPFHQKKTEKKKNKPRALLCVHSFHVGRLTSLGGEIHFPAQIKLDTKRRVMGILRQKIYGIITC